MEFLILDYINTNRRMLTLIYLRAFFREKIVISFNKRLRETVVTAVRIVSLFFVGSTGF